MLPAIGRLVSEVFYERRLEHGRNEPRLPAECLPEMLKSELLWIRTDELGDKAFQVKRAGGTSLYHPVEADAVVDVLLALDEHEPFGEWLEAQPEDEKAVGIICTYAAQRELIRQRLHSAGISGRLLANCKIDTVDSYQGKQNTIVILFIAAAIAGYTREFSPNELGIAAATVLGMLLLTALATHFERSSKLTGLAEGATTAEILSDFPTLTEDDLRGAVAFAAASAHED